MVAGALLFIVLILAKSKTTPDVITEKSWPVEVITAKKASYTPSIILYGNIESPHTTRMVAAMTADVVSAPAREGRKVNRGDILVALDDRDTKLLVDQRSAEVSELNAQIQTEEARYASDLKALEHEKKLVALQKKSVERHEALIKTQAASEAALDNAKQALRRQSLSLTERELSVTDHKNRLAQLQARLNRANALLAQAKLDLERTSVRAPFGGRITRLRVSPGDRIQAGQILVELYDLNAIEIRAQIPSQYLRIIKNAITAKKRLPASSILDNQTLKLELDRLASNIETGRGGVDALFYLITKTNHVSLGRSLEIILDLPEVKNAYAVPEQALYQNNRVYKLEKDRMKPVSVKRLGTIIDRNAGNRVLLSSTKLKDGDPIIITQLPNARTNLKAHIVNK